MEDNTLFHLGQNIIITVKLLIGNTHSRMVYMYNVVGHPKFNSKTE